MKVLLACGGTGGHIFPAFSVAEEFRAYHSNVEIVYVCGEKDIEDEIFRIVKKEKVIPVQSAPFRGAKSFLQPSFLIKLIKGFTKSLSFLKKEKPQVVVGFGGYFSFPVILAAKYLGIQTMIHEQNVVPGTANKYLAKWVDRVALSYEETKQYLHVKSQVRVTGNPIRSSIEKDTRREALGFFDFSDNRKTLLVLGGSQGSESINTLFMAALKILPSAIKSQMQVLHLCGKMPLDQAGAAYDEHGIPARVFSFFDRMDLAYGVADFAIGRAGATFLAEVKSKNIPAILIPYPFAGGHQIANAKVFCASSPGTMLEQKDATPEKVTRLIKDLFAQTSAPIKVSERGENARAVMTRFILEAAQA